MAGACTTLWSAWAQKTTKLLIIVIITKLFQWRDTKLHIVMTYAYDCMLADKFIKYKITIIIYNNIGVSSFSTEKQTVEGYSTNVVIMKSSSKFSIVV